MNRSTVTIIILAALLAISICNNVVTHYGALKLIDEVKIKLKEDRDDHRRWIREFTEEQEAKTKGYEIRLEKFRDILRRHRIKWHEEPGSSGAVLEFAPSVISPAPIGASPE